MKGCVWGGGGGDCWIKRETSGVITLRPFNGFIR